MRTAASRLKYRLTLQEPVLIPDGAGGYIVDWQDLTDVWAEIKPVSGKEEFSFGQLTSKATYKLFIRTRHDITSDKRFIYTDKTLNILSILESILQNNILEIIVEVGEI